MARRELTTSRSAACRAWYPWHNYTDAEGLRRTLACDSGGCQLDRPFSREWAPNLFLPFDGIGARDPGIVASSGSYAERN